MTIKCPICGGDHASFGAVDDATYRLSCPDCRVAIEKGRTTEEEARKYFENMDKTSLVIRNDEIIVEHASVPQTADEMLWERGYQRVTTGCAYIVRKYAKKVGSRTWNICANDDGTISIGPKLDMTGIENETVLAIAQLIREMEAEK